MNFEVSDEDSRKIAEFISTVECKKGHPSHGAIGGATTYSFTPTSLGIVFQVTHLGETLDLSDYKSW